jgi:RNA polymerase sigma-70 factor (ECF subfamily)
MILYNADSEKRLLARASRGELSAREQLEEQLLERASGGDSWARGQLLDLHRDRLCKMIALRLDRRVVSRFDPADVIQNALIEALKKLSDYLQERPVAFYPWLCRLAWEHLVKLHEKHLKAKRRTVVREQSLLARSDASNRRLIDRLVVPGSSPIECLLWEERCEQVQAALLRLSKFDREILLLRYLEELSMKKIAAVLEIDEGACKMRSTRALTRLSGVLGSDRRQVRSDLQKTLQHWQRDIDLVGLRDEATRTATRAGAKCSNLWAEMEALRARARQ